MSSPPRLLRWSRLFTVEVRHEYFANGICPGLVLRETPETSRAMVNLGLVRRDLAGGIAVFSDGSAPQDGFDLDFLLETTDPAFHSYTEIEGLAGAAALAFDSSRCAVPQLDGTCRLHIAPEASAADCMESGAARSGFKPGVPPVALVRIRATPPAEAASLLSGTRHVIAFRARRRYWKYFVLGQDASDPPPSIRDADMQEEFEPAVPALLAGDRPAVTLRSKAPIALRERPAQRFQLRVRTPAGERVLVKRLAVATPQLLGKETIDGREVVVSEIYVNL